MMMKENTIRGIMAILGWISIFVSIFSSGWNILRFSILGILLLLLATSGDD
jgi:membrane-bound ClpP family serine protease